MYKFHASVIIYVSKLFSQFYSSLITVFTCCSLFFFFFCLQFGFGSLGSHYCTMRNCVYSTVQKTNVQERESTNLLCFVSTATKAIIHTASKRCKDMWSFCVRNPASTHALSRAPVSTIWKIPHSLSFSSFMFITIYVSHPHDNPKVQKVNVVVPIYDHSSWSTYRLSEIVQSDTLTH